MKRLILALCTLFLAQSLQAADGTSPQGDGTPCADIGALTKTLCSALSPRRLTGTKFCQHAALFVTQQCGSPATQRRRHAVVLQELVARVAGKQGTVAEGSAVATQPGASAQEKKN